jgi:predicted deacylase
MLSSRPRRGQRQEIYYRARWVRVDDGRILIEVDLGDAVKAGDVLGADRSIRTNARSSALRTTRVLVALNQW